jgi:hypothetical protein
MVSIFPPKYGLTPIFNVSESSILEIIETGYSETFYKKAKATLDKYNNSVGIDEHKIAFVRLLKKRVKQVKVAKNPYIDFEDELNKVLRFLEEVVEKKESYFKDYIEEGRRLKRNRSKKYAEHKIQGVTYTPFGVFSTRENKDFIKSSGHLYFDVDVPLNRSEKKKIIQFFLDDPYIKSSWISFSGKGFGFIVKAKWETEKQMKKVYYKLLEYFQLELKVKYGIDKRVFDTQVCSLSRMNVISYGIIKNKTNFKTFEIDEYSDGLFNILHNYYKKDSIKELPNRVFTEKDFSEQNKILQESLKKRNKILIKDENEHEKFLEAITRTLHFTGSDDFNHTIKTYVSKVFRYRVSEDLIENFLFRKIPRTNGAESNYKRLWQCFSSYSEFRSVDPYFFY